MKIQLKAESLKFNKKKLDKLEKFHSTFFFVVKNPKTTKTREKNSQTMKCLNLLSGFEGIRLKLCGKMKLAVEFGDVTLIAYAQGLL